MSRHVGYRVLNYLLTTSIAVFIVYNLYDAFIHTWHFPITYDEVLTLRTIFYNPFKIVASLFNQGPKGYGGDFFPPLYYLLVHWLYQIGAYEFGLRLANNVCVLLAFIFVIKELDTIDEKIVGFCFALFVSLSMYYLDLFHLIRPYALYFCLQICSITSICVGIIRKDIKSIALAGLFNSLSLYAHYAAIGNIAAELGCFFFYYLTNKRDRPFYLRALVVLSAAAALFIPWLPGYFNVIKIAAATFGPSNIDLGKIWRLGGLIPSMFSNNDAVTAIYVLLALAGAVATDKKIVGVILVWGLAPTMLIAVSGHPVSVRHMVTLGSAILLLSGFGVARLLDSKLVKSASDQAFTGLVLALCLAIAISSMTTQDKTRHYAADVSPYGYHALTLALAFPKADLLVTRENDTFANTIFRWYLGGVVNTTYSSKPGGERNVLILERGEENRQDAMPVLKRMQGACGMAGFRVSGTKLKSNSPLRMDQARKSKTFAYSFADYAVLEDAFSWDNILVDTKNNTLEPAARLEDAAIVFRFHLPPARINYSITLGGLKETGSRDAFEILVSPDNVNYGPAPHAVVQTDKDGRFSLSCHGASEAASEDLYVKLLMRPGMAPPSSILKSLLIGLSEEQPAGASPQAGEAPGPSGTGVAIPVSPMADFSRVSQSDPRHLLQAPTETVQVVAPSFDADFDLERDLFTTTNVRIKRNEGCLTCDSEEPCRLVFFLNSPTRFQTVKVIFYPRIFNDKLRNNFVRVAYSYDGQNYHQIWSSENDGSLAWFGQREELFVPLQGDVRNLFISFELYSEGSQLQSFDTHAMYMVTESRSGEGQPPGDGQAVRLDTVKRLLGR